MESLLREFIKGMLYEDENFINPDAPEGNTPPLPQKRVMKDPGLQTVISSFVAGLVKARIPLIDYNKKKELENKLSAMLLDEIIEGKISELMSEYENTVFDKRGRRP